MWILPKQLHTLDSVWDTEALNLGLEMESSQPQQNELSELF